MKSARNQLDILSAYRDLGSYRAAAALCGTTHRTVRRVVERHGRPSVERPPRAKSGAVAITAGAAHTCATVQDGTAWCWGANSDCHLGDDTTVSPSLVPVHVVAR